MTRPERIGGYELESEIGRGGMGVVFRGRAAGAGDRPAVAVKVLLKEDPAALARFERERRLLGTLGEAEGFVPLLDAGGPPHAVRPFIVMPFLDGGTLRARIKNGLTVGETLTLGRRLAASLGAAHDRGIVHRDVKPENVLFPSRGARAADLEKALLSDLGLAKHFDRGAPGATESLAITREGVLVGTVAYMAPEQITATGSVGPPADVFALGAILYECLEGRPAFEAETFTQLLARITQSSKRPMENAALPPELVRVVERALEANPAARFADGASFARALGAVRLDAAGLDPAARSPGRKKPLLVAASAALLVGGGVLLLHGLTTSPHPVAEKKAAPPPPPAPPPAPRPEPAPVAPAPPPPPVKTPDSPAVARAWEKVRAHDLKAALTAANTAVDLEPRLARAWYTRGAIRNALKDVTGAISDLSRSLELDAQAAETWTERAAARYLTGDWDGVIDDADKAIALDAKSSLAWDRRAMARNKKGDTKGALEDLGKAIALSPLWTQPITNRATLRAATGDLDGAIADLTRSLELDPKAAEAWNDRGYVRMVKGDLPGAIADLGSALALKPDLVTALVNRGEAHERAGDKKAALADFARVLELDPKSPGVQKHVEKLRAAEGR